VNEAKKGCRNVKISSFSCVVRSSIRAPVAALPDRYGHGVKKGLSVPGSGITSPPRVDTDPKIRSPAQRSLQTPNDITRRTGADRRLTWIGHHRLH
jgi:hypothetical protein